MVSSTVNTWAVFRFALGYPDERHLERFAELCETVPETLAELRSLYIDLFEAWSAAAAVSAPRKRLAAESPSW